MLTDITIKSELQHKGNWVKINIPLRQPGAARAIFLTPAGEILKTVLLENGNNAIDISGIHCHAIHIKVETAYETIFKNIQLTER